MAPFGLHSLPTELHLLILESLASPLDLFSLISTSKQYYNTFLRTPERILAHVVRNAFGVNLQNALGAFYASRPAQDPEKAREAVESLLDDYYHDRLVLPTSLADLSQLSRLFLIIQRFITDYSVRSTKLLTGKPHVILPPWSHSSYQHVLRGHPVSLSATEETRLRRAFLRFDMYCHCFPLRGLDPVRRPPPLFNGRDQSNLFLCLFPRWEVEEICCAHQYLCAVADMAVRDVENDFVNEVVDLARAYYSPQLPREASTKESRRSKRLRNRDDQNDDQNASDKWLFIGAHHLDAETCSKQDPTSSDIVPVEGKRVKKQDVPRKISGLDLLGLDLFSVTAGDWSVDTMSRISSKGLSYLADLLLGDKDTRRTRFAEGYPSRGDFLNEALRVLTERDTRLPPSAEWKFDGMERWDRYNYGWSLLSARKYKLFLRTPWKGRRSERDLGYVFWDAARLRDADLKSSPVFPKWERQSAEERLKDVYLPFSLLESVAKRYSNELNED
ncbi:hypothetical protein F4821DRAFT_181103 [Hypoxylon rubiginosum]|uniref:Uncharacterized protein n=1 Tax=Hypoxylon rubiginosum TaxID=110542 RepID=A0ACC0CU06_9PEZI|nr:hypothetical protein F4821DRAFT_181103 [Hypoxylon rubiginosum]